jgi:MEMO1 family protein
MAARAAAVAGSWYPSDPSRLTAELEEHLAAAAPPPLPGRVVALIAPHAGLRYSGPVAAFAYKTLVGRRGLTVFLVGPSHRVAFRGVSLYAAGEFETPLGPLAIDERSAAALLAAAPLIVNEPGPHRSEHSLEMQLPFLKHLVPDAAIVPMLMGTQRSEEIDALAPALAAAAAGRDDVVLVASSDLSHYEPAPIAHDLDARVVGDVEGFDPESLERRLDAAPHTFACGGGPMVAVMKAARLLGASRAHVLRYADSGDVPGGDKSRVVGYLAAAFTAEV